jgi:hypothetical protein
MAQDFYRSYGENIAKIIQVRDLTTGTHPIDSEKAKVWISSQLNQTRRMAAANLIANTMYITFNDMFAHVKGIIQKIYSELKNPENLYLYVGKPSRSNYFIAVIAIYFIRLLGLPDPKILHNLEDELVNQTVLIIDDMAYTGIQLGRMYEKLNVERNGIKLFVGLVAISEQAVEVLEKLPLILVTNIVVPNLKRVLGKRAFLELSYYFSPQTEGHTQVSVYFDHKIADELSTFTKTLMFGPIPPTNLGYDPLLQHDMYTLLNGIVDQEVRHPKSNTPEEHKIEDADLVLYDKEFESYIPLLEDIHINDQKVDRDEPLVTFMPFITGCNPPTDEIINKISYFSFISGRLLDEEQRNLYQSKLDALVAAKNRCIKSFYKEGEYIMS